MTKQEQLRYEYFIETGIVWIDTNDNIEMDYLKWVENKALTIHVVVVPKGTLCLCGQPELPQYSPCCSLRCWHDQFD